MRFGGLLRNMASKYFVTILKSQFHPKPACLNIQGRPLHTSQVLLRVTAGRIKRTPNRTKAVNYEDSLTPPNIAHRKSWNSWNTSTIEGGHRPSQIAIDDLFIRKFMQGTFPSGLLSKVIIKRQYNIIRIAALVKFMAPPSRMCFLIGYTEEILSHWFQCIVKLELQVLYDSKVTIFRYY